MLLCHRCVTAPSSMPRILALRLVAECGRASERSPEDRGCSLERYGARESPLHTRKGTTARPAASSGGATAARWVMRLVVRGPTRQLKERVVEQAARIPELERTGPAPRAHDRAGATVEPEQRRWLRDIVTSRLAH
jgi:hypothetical protein